MMTLEPGQMAAATSQNAAEVHALALGVATVWAVNKRLAGQRIPARMMETLPTWEAACKRAGVPGFRFHDLRHTWASWHAMAGTPLSVLQELGGWHSPQMVQRYAHLAPEHLVAAAEKVTL